MTDQSPIARRYEFPVGECDNCGALNVVAVVEASGDYVEKEALCFCRTCAGRMVAELAALKLDAPASV